MKRSLACAAALACWPVCVSLAAPIAITSGQISTTFTSPELGTHAATVAAAETISGALLANVPGLPYGTAGDTLGHARLVARPLDPPGLELELVHWGELAELAGGGEISTSLIESVGAVEIVLAEPAAWYYETLEGQVLAVAIDGVAVDVEPLSFSPVYHAAGLLPAGSHTLVFDYASTEITPAGSPARGAGRFAFTVPEPGAVVLFGLLAVVAVAAKLHGRVGRSSERRAPAV